MTTSSRKLQAMLDGIQTLDPDKIDFSDPQTSKHIMVTLLNAVEFVLQENQRLKEENQQLKNENARLNLIFQNKLKYISIKF